MTAIQEFLLIRRLVEQETNSPESMEPAKTNCLANSKASA